MSCTIDKILTDARTLLERLKEHDTAAESLIDQSAVLHRRVSAGGPTPACGQGPGGAAGPTPVSPRQGPGPAAEQPDPSRLRPHVVLAQENTQIRDLQQENRGERGRGRGRRMLGDVRGCPGGDACPVVPAGGSQLWVSLEEHQDALELIMSKYRKQMLQLLEGRKREEAEPVLKVHQANSGEIESQIDRICEMGEVMRKAVQVDDEQFFKVQEKLAQLELENKELRELLSISKESFE
ncbi:hypothetical protein IHE44_0008364, partial [Lamprotornis superbus]